MNGEGTETDHPAGAQRAVHLPELLSLRLRNLRGAVRESEWNRP